MWEEIKAVFPEGSLKLERTLCLVKPDAINHVVRRAVGAGVLVGSKDGSAFEVSKTREAAVPS